MGQFGLRPLVEGQPASLLVGLDLVLALNFLVAMVAGLGLARMWLRPKAYVVISEAALEEALPGLAAKLEERYDMTFLRGLYEDLVAAAKKHPVV